MKITKVTAAVLVMGLAATSATGDNKADLKLGEVTLFSSGVGYFHREATLDGSGVADLQFRTEQINDILKSLVVQDLDGGNVEVVTYAPKDPLERTLQSFGVNVTGKESLAQLLDSLRGEPVRITGPRDLKGTILGVEKRKTLSGENAVESDVLNLLSDQGMVQLPMADLQGIELLNEKTASELNKAMAALAATHDAGKKSVLIRFSGEGKRRVAASFLLETPIWKTSYRLVLTEKGKPWLQGWAIVENTTDEDWKDVRLSLVSGRPISFVMDLYTPLYLKRPVEDLELYASLRPPEFAGGMGGLALGEAVDNLTVNAPAAPQAAAPAEGGESRFGLAIRKGVVARARPAESTPGLSFFGRESGVKSVAQASDAGELFQYAIEAPVTIARQQSAMLPIVNAEVTGEKLSIFNPASHPKYPLNGLKLKNSTELSLMQGPVTLFDGGTYAGDAKLPDLKAGEERLVAYALDLGTEVQTDSKSVPTQIVTLAINRGTLIRRNRAIDEREYKLRNKQAKAKTVLIEQQAGNDWKLLDPAKPYEKTEDAYRFKVDLPAGGTAAQKVRLERIYSETIVLSEMDLKTIQYYITSVGGPVLSPAVKQALEKVVSLRTELDRIGRDRGAKDQVLKETGEEQERIRKNLQVLQQNSDAYSRQLSKLDKLETQIEQLREQLAALRDQEAKQRTALETYLSELTIE